MEPLKLFMLLLGASPPGRHIEQHDTFFAIGRQLKDLVPAIYNFWPEAKKKLHIDGWREVTQVDGFTVTIEEANGVSINDQGPRLFFINLGGYKENEFEEYHYKMIVAGNTKAVVSSRAQQTAFYKHTGFKGASSHIDDKYGVDVDDMYEITDILPPAMKSDYHIILTPAETQEEDKIHLGYFKLDKLEKLNA